MTTADNRLAGDPTTGNVPAVSGVISAAEVCATAATIVAAQRPSGMIPWYSGGDADVWDHVECAMALSAVGEWAAAVAAYSWLARAQRGDGSWPMRVDSATEAPVDTGADTNQCAYIATGVWHHLLVTGDRTFGRAMWPTVRAAVDFVLAQQGGCGEIAWAIDSSGGKAPESLLAGCSSIHHSLRCAIALADFLGIEQPGWRRALKCLGSALLRDPEVFEDRQRFSMDWYYPVLSGVLSADVAARTLRWRWDEFVVPGFGVRCVADRPWVTGAETCELVLALDSIGNRDDAVRIFASMAHLRDASGAYWTGHVVDDGVRWPVERSTWTAAVVVLAADALSDTTGGASIFRSAQWPNVSAGRPEQLDRPEEDQYGSNHR